MKRGKKMVMLLGALVLLLGGYAMLGQMNETAAVKETKGSYPLWPQGKALSSLTWENEGETFSFKREGSVFVKDGDTSFPVNQTELNALVNRIEGLSAVSELTNVDNPADYGLDTPVFTVSAKDESGGEWVYAMGDQTPFQDGYYLSVSGSDSVYVIISSLDASFDKTLTQLAEMEPLPQIANPTRMTVGDTLDIAFSAETGLWTDAATGEALDTEAAASLADTAKSLAWIELIETSASEETLAAWVLDDAQAIPVTILGDEQERTVLLGGADESGARYARLPQSGMVYTVSGTDADALLGAGMDTLFEKTVFDMAADQIESLAFEWEGSSALLTAADDESSSMQGIVDLLAGLEGTQRVAMSEAGEAILTLTAAGADTAGRTLTFYAYSVDDYLVGTSGEYGVLVDAQDVDRLIRMLKQLS